MGGGPSAGTNRKECCLAAEMVNPASGDPIPFACNAGRSSSGDGKSVAEWSHCREWFPCKTPDSRTWEGFTRSHDQQSRT